MVNTIQVFGVFIFAFYDLISAVKYLKFVSLIDQMNDTLQFKFVSKAKIKTRKSFSSIGFAKYDKIDNGVFTQIFTVPNL